MLGEPDCPYDGTTTPPLINFLKNPDLHKGFTIQASQQGSERLARGRSSSSRRSNNLSNQFFNLITTAEPTAAPNRASEPLIHAVQGDRRIDHQHGNHRSETQIPVFPERPELSPSGPRVLDPRSFGQNQSPDKAMRHSDVQNSAVSLQFASFMSSVSKQLQDIENRLSKPTKEDLPIPPLDKSFQCETEDIKREMSANLTQNEINLQLVEKLDKLDLTLQNQNKALASLKSQRDNRAQPNAKGKNTSKNNKKRNQFKKK